MRWPVFLPSRQSPPAGPEARTQTEPDDRGPPPDNTEGAWRCKAVRVLKTLGWTLVSMIGSLVLFLALASIVLRLTADPGPDGDSLVPIVIGVAAAWLASLVIKLAKRKRRGL
jgi:hypothetical protein